MYRIYEKHLEHKKLFCQIGSSSVDGTMIQEIGHKLVHLMTYVCKLNTHKKNGIDERWTMPSKKIYNPDVLFKVQGLIIISSEMSWTMNKKEIPNIIIMMIGTLFIG